MSAPRTTGVKYRDVRAGETLGRYALIEELGQGGMATVYLARDQELRREVALKVLHSHVGRQPDAVARFLREARAAAALDHPHILRVLDVGGSSDEETGGAGVGDGDRRRDPPYLVMELIRGDNLQEFLAQSGAPLAEVVALIGLTLCDALAEAHRHGIIHRDVKPANVMIADGGRIVLSDFGVAHLVEGDTLVTQTGALLGTPAFMSPEQAMGEKLDPRSDLYSLGALLYRAATGALPFSGPLPKVVAAIAAGKLVPAERRNPRIGAPLARVIAKLLAPERDDRFADASATAAALAEVTAIAGLGDRRAELSAYFASPGDYNADRLPRIVQAHVAAAQRAAERRQYPQALALADRALALEPDHPQAVALVEALGPGNRLGARVRSLLAVGAVLAALGGAAAVWLWVGGDNGAGGVAGIAPDGGDGSAGTALAGAGGRELDAAAPLVADVDVDVAGLVGAEPGPGPARAQTSAAAAPAADRRAGVRRGRGAAGPRSGRGDRAGPGTAPAGADTPVAAGDRGQSLPTRSVESAPDAGAALASPDAEVPVMGAVRLIMNAWCDVAIDGQSRGRADPSRALSVAPGRHEIVCSQGPGRPTFRKTQVVVAGRTHAVRGEVLKPVRIAIEVSGGDRVRLGGAEHANGHELQLVPGRYRVDVLKGAEVQKRGWVTIRGGSQCKLRDEPEIDCYR